MQVGGKEYKFKLPDTLKLRELVRAQGKFAAFSNSHMAFVQASFSDDSSVDEKYKPLPELWRGFVENAFENPDEDLKDLEKVPGMAVPEVLQAFFELFPKPNQSKG